MIYGITGFKGTGKSEAAKYLESKGFVRHNFKDALVAEIKERFPDLLREIAMTDADYCPSTDDLFEIKPPLMRALMQNYGTEVRRKDDPDYWVKQWEEKVLEHHCNPATSDQLVVDDVRFINESEAIKERGGKIIRIIRSDIKDGGTHSSEIEQSEIVADYTIEVEYGDLPSMYKQLDAILTE